MSVKSYLGDSVYAEFDGYMVTLSTENGHGTSNVIYLEPQTCDALEAFLERIAKAEGAILEERLRRDS